VEEPSRQYLPALQGPVPSGPEEPDSQYRPAGHREQLPDSNVVQPTGQETPEGTSQDPRFVVEPAGQYLSAAQGEQAGVVAPDVE
jgi:hypothetical protein